jgi:hypothetical protein
MKTFADTAGRTWTVAINVDAIKRVRGLVDVNLLEIVDGKLLERLVADPILLCDTVYAVCKPQADAAGVSDEDFGRSMGGDSIDLATTALLEELVGFFPSGRRAVLAKALTKLWAFESKALLAASARLDDPRLDERLERELSSLSGNWPESSASIPAP